MPFYYFSNVWYKISPYHQDLWDIFANINNIGYLDSIGAKGLPIGAKGFPDRG